MGWLMVDNRFRLDTNRFGVALANAADNTTLPFKMAMHKLKIGKIKLHPDEIMNCVISGKTRDPVEGFNYSLPQIQSVLVDYCGKNRGQFDATLAYDREQGRKTLLNGEHSEIEVNGEIPKFPSPGSTIQLTVSTPEGVTIFPFGEVSPINSDSDASTYVSMFSFSPNEPNGSRIEITHIGGFNRTVKLKFPAHLNNGKTDFCRRSVIKMDVELPDWPSVEVRTLKVDIVGNKATMINLEEYGLYIPCGDDTFNNSFQTVDEFGQPKLFLHPRIIDGLAIMQNSREYPELIEIVPVLSFDGDEKTIITHFYSIDTDKLVPVQLNLRFLPED